MEEKKPKKISISTILLIIAILAIIVMGSFIFKLNNDKAREIKKSTELQAHIDSLNATVNDLQGKMNIISETVNTSNSSTNDFVSKVDDTEDWVYDAKYTKDVTAESYSINNKTYYAKDIIVPYININSTYANSSNSDIKKIFDDAIKTYNTGVSDKVEYVDECGYKKYINNNSLSVVLTYGAGATDVVHPKYYTYNINLKTGNQLSYEEIYTIAGFNSSTITSKVEAAITQIMKEKLKDYKEPNNDNGTGKYYPDGTNFDTYNNESINNYKNSINNNTLEYFLSDNGKLNVIVKLSIPAGTGETDTIVTID